MNLSPEEIERRTRRIVACSAKGAAAGVAKISPEERRGYASLGGKARSQRYREMKEAMIPDGVIECRIRRRRLEAKAANLCEIVVDAAFTGGKVDLRGITSVLRVLRMEIKSLWSRERVLMRDMSGGGGRHLLIGPVYGYPQRQREEGIDPDDVDPATLAPR